MGAEHDAARNRNSLPRLTLSVRSQNGYAIAEVGGDLDIACAPALREQLLGVLGPHASRIVVDLSGVTFCDASGLAVLTGARRRAERHGRAENARSRTSWRSTRQYGLVVAWFPNYSFSCAVTCRGVRG